MDSHYVAYPSPYNSTGSFMDFFAGLTYDHVNFTFSGSSQLQDNEYSPVSMAYGLLQVYKYGYSESGPTQYYSNSPSYDVLDHLMGIDEYSRRDSEFPCAMINEQSERVTNTNIRPRNRDCPRSDHNSQEYQELLELGETVGTQSRGLSHEQISSLPVSKFRCCFLRRKSQSERLVFSFRLPKQGVDKLFVIFLSYKQECKNEVMISTISSLDIFDKV